MTTATFIFGTVATEICDAGRAREIVGVRSSYFSAVGIKRTRPRRGNELGGPGNQPLGC